MKAVEAMFWLLLFNISFALVNGLEIFNLGGGGIISYSTMSSAQGESAVFFFLKEYAAIWLPLIGGALAGAVTGFLSIRIKTSAAAAYSAFSLFLTVIYINTASIFTSIILSIDNPSAQGVVTALAFIFLAITGLMFALGLIQLIRGGIQSSM